MWREIMSIHGFQAGDIVVASETYGKRLAEECGGVFMPYDLDRSILPIKATPVREGAFDRDLKGNYQNYEDMLPEFQSILRARITIFGAESTGKTTLARDLGRPGRCGRWLFEYARPYLENTVNEINVKTMTDIWHGQRALQKQVDWMDDVPYVIQDTDLFSTVGYWRFPHWQETLGECPQGLIDDALALKSDLYIVTRSNIPFEEDPLRYGGTVREGSDEYWIALLEEYDLPYFVLEDADLVERFLTSKRLINDVLSRKAATLHYDREANP
jgi:HTH-type transcriptional repressor of NAD biosynthesis genes